MSIAQKVMGNPSKYSVEELTHAVQSGVLPAYIGIPLIQDKMQKQKEAQAMAASPQQPPIAEQVLAEARQGVPALPSGLPTQMAGGGIVAFADGGYYDDEEDDDDDTFDKEMLRVHNTLDALREQVMAAGKEAPQMMASYDAGKYGPEGMSSVFPAFMATESKEGMSVKRGNEPAKSIERKSTSVTHPAGIEGLLKAIEQKESGGRGDYDKYGRLLTSPAGAQGRMQVMPNTARDPGFGIRPAREGDVEDLARVGREYYTKMLERYGDPKLAAIAYNWGPSNTDKWLMAGADMSKLPRETQQYAQGFAKGGIAHFDNGGLSDLFNKTPEEIKDIIRRIRKMESARAVFGAAPEAAPAAPASAVSTGVSPVAAQAERTLGQRLMSAFGSAMGAPAAVTTAGGAAATGLAGGILGGASDEGLAQLSSDIGSDTGLAAAIMAQGRENERKAPPVAPKPVAPVKPTYKVSPLPQTPVPANRLTPQQMEQKAEQDLLSRESPYTLAQDEQDRLYMPQPGRDMSQPVTMPETAAPAPKEPSLMEDLRKQIKEGLANSKTQKEQDAWLSLLAGGLGMLGGTSPFASANIGQGAMQGLTNYRQAAQARAADERALLNAQLGLGKLEQYGDVQKETMALRKELKERELAQAKALAESKLAETAERRGLAEQKMYAERLAQIEKLAQNQALAQYKGAILPEQKEQILAKALTELRTDPGYREMYKRVHGFDPGGGILTYDPASRSLR